jgi:large subunit ribosomal protein L15
MPLQRRIPKRGFKNPFRKVYQVVNLKDLERCAGSPEINPDVLAEKRLIRNPYAPVKILGDGGVAGAIVVRVHAVSAAAREKIEAAGGQVNLLQ